MTARAAAAIAAPPPTHTASAAKHWPVSLETYLKGEEEELKDALADFAEIEGVRRQMDFECGAAKHVYRRILGRIALGEKWLPQRRRQAAAGAGNRVEALARLEGVLGRLRDKVAKAHAELKECIGRMQKWHSNQTFASARVDECTRSAQEARWLATVTDDEEQRREEDRLLELARVQDPDWGWFPFDPTGVFGVAERPSGGVWAFDGWWVKHHAGGGSGRGGGSGYFAYRSGSSRYTD